MSKELSKIFTKDFNEALVHQVTTDFLSNQRSGTKAQKNFGEMVNQKQGNLDFSAITKFNK